MLTLCIEHKTISDGHEHTTTSRHPQNANGWKSIKEWRSEVQKRTGFLRFDGEGRAHFTLTRGAAIVHQSTAWIEETN